MNKDERWTKFKTNCKIIFPNIIKFIVINKANTFTKTIRMDNVLVVNRFLCSSIPKALFKPFIITKIALDDKNIVIIKPKIAKRPPCSKIITSFNTSQSTNNYTISISGKDKMCLLNGEVSGTRAVV